MMHTTLDQNHWLLGRARPRLRVLRQRCDRAPRIRFPADDGEAVVRDVVATEFVDCVDVRRRGDAECVLADQGFVREVEEAGDEREFSLGHAGACLEVAPLGAVLVRPRTPGLGNIVLSVESGIVVAEALVLGLAAGGARDDLGGVDVVDEVEHLGGEIVGFLFVAAGHDERFDGGRLGRGGRGVDGGGGDVVTVLVEGGVVECRIPVAALPAADTVAEDVGEVIVVSGR